MFQENGDPNSFFDKTFKRFLTEKDAKEKTIPNTSDKKSYLIVNYYSNREVTNPGLSSIAD